MYVLLYYLHVSDSFPINLSVLDCELLEIELLSISSSFMYSAIEVEHYDYDYDYVWHIDQP